MVDLILEAVMCRGWEVEKAVVVFYGRRARWEGSRADYCGVVWWVGWDLGGKFGGRLPICERDLLVPARNAGWSSTICIGA